MSGDAPARQTTQARQRRAGLEYPIWATVHGLAVLTVQGPPATPPRRNHHPVHGIPIAVPARAFRRRDSSNPALAWQRGRVV